MQRIVSGIIVATMCLTQCQWLIAQGTWTAIATPNPEGICNLPILLSDGTVIIQGSSLFGTSPRWTKLTPDTGGNYVNGTWTSIASMGTPRNSFPSCVLPSGKVFVLGGEYIDNSSNQAEVNTGEIYDPIANTWTPIPNFPESQFGDTATSMLTTGKVLCGSILTPRSYLFDPLANTWTPTGSKLRSDQSNEETWVTLPDGSVLSYDVFGSPATGAGSAQRYIPSTGRWVATGPVPVPLTSDALGRELGPAMLLPDGRVFQLGANNNSVLYSPSTDTWAQGPSLPTNMGCDDAPAAMLPNGHVLFIADTSNPLFSPPAKVYDFDPVANTFTNVTPSGALGTDLASNSASSYCMLMLPNGHVLLTTGHSIVFDYAPTGSPNPAWAPTVQSITLLSGTTYTLKGTQINGISEGTSFGDDLENSTNYPIVRLKNNVGVVKYARTANWSPGVVASGSRQLTAQFTLPAGTPNGTYQLNVIANGIPSATQSFTVGGNGGGGGGGGPTPSNVQAAYDAATKTLTLTGDENANSLTVSLQAGTLKVEGANLTSINHTPSFSVAHTGKLVLIANLNNGDDSISVIGVDSSTSTINLGAGNDKAAFTLSHIGTLNIDGGPGIDALLTTSTTVGTFTKTGFP